VFTAPGTLAMYRERYPRIAAERLQCIANGYDEEDFVAAGTRAVQREGGAGRFELLHSGVLYPIERDPRPLFEALARLKRAGATSAATLRLTLRATAHDAEFQPLLAQFGIADHVRLAPALDYHDALAEMMQADGLLLLQAANCNHQIPAKLYEYLRAGRPILALTDAAGDTAAQVRSVAAGMICPLDDAAAIAQSLTRFISDVRQGTAPRASLAAAQAFSRSAQAGRLAELFDSISPKTASPR
jgi:glycosyltransferase involved in cell wall biosynthesis